MTQEKTPKLAFTRSQEWEKRRKATETCANRGIMALERGQWAIYEEQSFLQILVFLVSNYHLATVRERQPSALTRWKWCALTKCLIALHSILPAAHTWGEIANEQEGQRCSFSELGLFMLTNFPTQRVSPCSWRCPLGPRGPNSSVLIWCFGYSVILLVTGNSVQQNCYCRWIEEELVLDWLWTVQGVAQSSCW